jgi:predicted metalloprotease
MRWRTGRRSENVEDVRGARVPLGGMRLGFGGLVAMVLVGWLLGVDPLTLLRVVGGTVETTQVPDGSYPEPGGAPGQGDPPDELGDFVSVVLADTEDTWSELFAERGASYQAPRLVLFTDLVRSACGMGQSAMGPFYCPADAKVYIDLGFYRDLRERFRAPGDFAQAYVIAHEVGHHVQTLVGTSEKVQRMREGLPEADANALSVRLELQADCYAGIWAHHADRARQILEQGDVEEGLAAAAALGDDRIQRESQGTVVPESFTHGSSRQRVEWFRRGLESGSIDACDTFGAAAPRTQQLPPASRYAGAAGSPGAAWPAAAWR